jgi:hypothetical protein
MELHDVTKAIPLSGYILELAFDDGTTGTVDIAQIVRFEGVFAPLRDGNYFRQAFVHPEFGVVCWPNGADIDSDLLYSIVVGKPLPVAEPA